MRHIKGDRLHVYVGAAEARRRLKGHGFGVRKISSGGRKQADIIHTATGGHLRELRLLFADALEPPPEPDGDDRDGDDRDGDPEQEEEG